MPAAQINRILPVRSSCIMPCLSWRALASFGFQRGDLGVHVGEDREHGGLLFGGWCNRNFAIHLISSVSPWFIEPVWPMPRIRAPSMNLRM